MARMTVADLRKALKGVRGNLPVYTADHDHGEYETNGWAGEAMVVDQSKMDKWHRENLDKEFHIKGKYFVIKV